MMLKECSNLEKLRKNTVVVADTGDFESIEKYKPTDATTNPSLLMQAVSMPKYSSFIEKAIEYAKNYSLEKDIIADIALNQLSVLMGIETLKIIPGRVSTEVNPCLSFDTEKTIEEARKLIFMYEEKGYSKDRVLIKIASTWEGIQAAKVLEEKYKIHCNMTLIFSLTQAIACAEANVTLISPFVGRILDWYVKNTDKKNYSPDEHPGIKSVRDIDNYFKYYNYKTKVMGASFRSVSEILALNGIDIITISPKLLEQLNSEDCDMPIYLSNEIAQKSAPKKININQASFRWMMNENAMATEKLAEGIRKFYQDGSKLRELIYQKI